MILECEGKQPLQHPNPKQTRNVISALRSYGPSSYASLTKEDGSYLQVAGGGISCLLEFYRADLRERHRAYGDVVNKACPDGTILVCGSGNISMQSDEWLRSELVADVFCAFLQDADFLAYVHWRPSPGF